MSAIPHDPADPGIRWNRMSRRDRFLVLALAYDLDAADDRQGLARFAWHQLLSFHPAEVALLESGIRELDTAPAWAIGEAAEWADALSAERAATASDLVAC